MSNWRSIRHARFIALSMLALLLMTAFQNCSEPVKFKGSESAPQTNMSGNGGPYDGKPEPGIYLRHSPQGCSGSTSSATSDLIGIMNIDEENAKIQSDVCVGMDYSIGFSDSRMEYSAYNREYIGFNSAIFEYDNGSTPKGAVDVWCRHPEAEFGIDLVVKSDLSGNLMQGLIYSGSRLNTSTPVIRPKQEISISKSSAGQTLLLSSTNLNLRAEIDLASRGPTQSTYSGRLQLSLDGRELDLNVNCRILTVEPAVYFAAQEVLAMYQFNGGAVSDGSTVTDSSRNAHHGSLVNSDDANVAYVTGVKDRALQLGGAGDYVNLPGLAAAAGVEFSVSLWARPKLNTTANALFSVNTPTGRNVVKLETGGCSGTVDRENLTYEIDNTCYDTGIRIVDGNWHMLTLTVGAGQVTVYADGAAVSPSQPVLRAFSATDLWAIGMDLDTTGASDFLSGEIDEVIVWRTVLSPDQVVNAFR